MDINQCHRRALIHDKPSARRDEPSAYKWVECQECEPNPLRPEELSISDAETLEPF